MTLIEQLNQLQAVVDLAKLGARPQVIVAETNCHERLALQAWREAGGVGRGRVADGPLTREEGRRYSRLASEPVSKGLREVFLSIKESYGSAEINRVWRLRRRIAEGTIKPLACECGQTYLIDWLELPNTRCSCSMRQQLAA